MCFHFIYFDRNLPFSILHEILNMFSIRVFQRSFHCVVFPDTHLNEFIFVPQEFSYFAMHFVSSCIYPI